MWRALQVSHIVSKFDRFADLKQPGARARKSRLIANYRKLLDILIL
jgi:hypothetical protein